jgi:CRISPR-associated protein Csd1
MIFEALHDLYGRLEEDPEYEVAPPGRSYQKVGFIVVIDRDGTLVDIQDARTPSGPRMVPRRVLVLGSTKPSGSGLNPCFLWDAPTYLLGWNPSDPERGRRTFNAFRDRHLREEAGIGAADFSAVCRFLESWDPGRCRDFPVLEEAGTGFGVFQIRGEPRFVHQLPEIEAWWVSRPPEEEPGPMGQCLVTGRTAPIARLHPKIKGVAGSQPSGATIAGFNDSAYWSYGNEQSFNAPVSGEAAHRYSTALNALTEGSFREKHRLVVGHTTVVFWTDRPCAAEDVFLAFAARGSDAVDPSEAQDPAVRGKISAFLRALKLGREAYAALDAASGYTGYFLLGLAAPTPARVAVRFFHRSTLADLLEKLRIHHRDTCIERRFGEGAKHPEPEFPSINILLDQTCPMGSNKKPDRDKIPPLLAGMLLEAIVTGCRYPDSLYSAVMRRIVADREVNYPRACVIKGYLVRNMGKEVSMSLDRTRTEPAYRLGRLFAALEKTQRDALGGELNASIRESFFASASATPGVVFPRLLRTYQHHLAKLEGGRKVNREKLVQEILDSIDRIPAQLGLPDQGLFAIGYYHQMNAFYSGKDPEEATEKY